jgi:SEC-C motif
MKVESFEPLKNLPRTEEAAEQFRAGIQQAYEKATKDVVKIAETLDAEYAFEVLFSSHLVQLGGGYKEAKHGSFPVLIELGAFYLYPLFGLGGNRDGSQVQKLIDSLTELNSLRVLTAGLEVKHEDKELASIQAFLILRAESVRGSSYPPQLRRRVEAVQAPHDGWFTKAVGISPSRALRILDAHGDALNCNFQATKNRFNQLTGGIEELITKFGADVIAPKDPAVIKEKDALGEKLRSFMEEMPILAPSREQIAGLVPDLSNKEWSGLRELIGLTPESRKKMERAREIRSRPVYYLSNDRFVFFDQSSVYDALFEAFDEITRRDSSFRDKEYVPQLSKWTEQEVAEHLRRVFPSDSVYTSLTYADPDKLGGEAELDCAVSWPPFLLLVEVKGRQFRPRSRLGDPARLRDDLRANIEDSFSQASRAMRYIEQSKVAKFVEKNTDRVLEVRADQLQRIFPISVTLHHFAGLTTQLALLKKLGLFKNSAYPWSVSLGDLDIITRFSGTPDVFLHYVQRRLDLQRSEKDVFADEVDLFGTYLDSRLHPSEFWESKTEDGGAPTLYGIIGGSERFDEWHEAELGRREKNPDIKLDFPPGLTEVLRELRLREDDASRWIAFALLDLSPGAVSQLEKDLAEVRRHAEPGTRLPRAILKDGDVAVSIIACNGLSAEELHRQAVLRINLEKYRLRTSASLLIAIDVLDQNQPFEFALWAEGPWKYEEIFEKLLADDKPTAIISDHVPGRNEPCPCGSGKKFKKCCLGKLQLERRSR